MARLILMFRDKILGSYPLATDGGLTIGRHGSNQVIIDNLAVSGYHARIDPQPEGFTITDLQSKNGVFINHQPVADGKLSHKDEVTIGKHTLLVDLLDEIDVEGTAGDGGGRTGAPSTMDDAQTMILDTSRARQMRGEETPPPEPDFPERDNLTLLSGGQGELALSQRQITIGKNIDADIVVRGLWSLLVGSPAATIVKQAGHYFMSYAGGLIKPKCNGSSVKGTIQLHHEDVVEVGPVKAKIQISKRTAQA